MKRLLRTLKQLQAKKAGDPVGNSLKMCSEFADGPCLKFFEKQLRVYFKHGKGRRWTSEQKTVAFALHFKSPSSYHLLRTMYALASLTSLKRCLSGLETNPGYNETIFTLLQSKLTALDEKKEGCSCLL